MHSESVTEASRWSGILESWQAMPSRAPDIRINVLQQYEVHKAGSGWSSAASVARPRLRPPSREAPQGLGKERVRSQTGA
jgi:hypothetical protein